MEDNDNRLEREIQHYCLFHSKSLYTDGVQGRQRVCGFTQRPRDGDAAEDVDGPHAHPKHHDPPVRPVLHPLRHPQDSTGKALANKPIDIWVRHDGDNGILWKTMTTDSNGKYSTTASSTQKAYIRTVFKGDSSYAASMSSLVTISVH